MQYQDNHIADQAVYAYGLHALAHVRIARAAMSLPPLGDDENDDVDFADAPVSAEDMALITESYAAIGWPAPESFGDAPWLPIAALATLAPGFMPTRAEVAAWCADNGVKDPHTARDAAACLEADIAVKGMSVDPMGMFLPLEFWERRGFLRHIRDAAWARDESPHGVLLAVLALLSANVDPSVQVETGIKSPLPLNMFVGLVSTSGEGKSSAMKAATRLLEITYPDPLTPGAVAASEVPRMLNIGSGEGIAEAYMGKVKAADPENGGKPTPERCQVRFKLMFHIDEAGEMIAKMAQKNATLPATLRSAWSGELKGSANASAETYREISEFSLGILAGFQRAVLGELLTAKELENGTPQRFLFGPVMDPFVPEIEDTPNDPGPLRIGPLPVGEVHVCAELKRAIKVESR
ncbi:DUF3987 domain-containing protein [Nocardia fluminea]|uniref:DUF3987 domain-containing protein n=1 Tax=Nocardia fluminea TaxID=134984 RepID=UPI0034233065